MNIRNQISLSIIGLVGMLAAMPASAADVDDLDVKIYPGQLCIATNGVSGINAWRGRAINERTDIDIWVDCPVIRDVVGASGRVVSAWVKVIDQHYSDDVACALWSQNSDSGDGWSGYYQVQYSVGSSPSVQTIPFTTRTAYSTNASYMFECQIPNVYSGNSSHITAYSVIDD